MLSAWTMDSTIVLAEPLRADSAVSFANQSCPNMIHVEIGMGTTKWGSHYS